MEITSIRMETANFGGRNGQVSVSGAVNDANVSGYGEGRRFDSFISGIERRNENTYYRADGTTANTVIRASSTTRTAATAAERKILPYLLAGKMSGVYVSSTGGPSINSATDYTHWQTAMDTIKGDHAQFDFSPAYQYSQTEEVNKYGYTNRTTSCATYALATALSIKNNQKITPDKISTNSSTDGHGTRWGDHGAYFISETSESNVLLGVDAQLQLGNPVLVHAKNDVNQHWATVIGKEEGKYIIIDPYDGERRPLSEMKIYKDGGKLTDYVILSNQY